ncbi:MAG: thermonuclease family protein [archaeon]
MNKKSLIILILFFTSAIFYYHITDPTQTQTFQITRVIDGDTIETSTNIQIRLLGINTPEKSQPFYTEATNFLSQQIQNKSVKTKIYGTDKYGRTLAYIFLDDKEPAPTYKKLKSVRVNINEQILKQGLATLYYYEKDNYYEKLKQAEEFARLNQKALWQKSPDANCIEIIKFQTDEPEILILQNTCDKILNITFKDDANHIYNEILNPKSQLTKTTSHIWNDDGDTIYIRDEKGLLIFQRYN